MFTDYIVIVKVDRGTEVLKVSTQKNINTPAFIQSIEDSFKDYFTSNSAKVVSIKKASHVSSITI